MLLTVDVGNTSIALGLFKGKKLIKRWFLPTPSKGAKKSLTRNRIIKEIRKAFSLSGLGSRDDTVIISSVVPHVSDMLLTIFRQKLNRQ